MKDFFIRNKQNLLKAAILMVITVLMCVPVTMRALVGAVGYAGYFYLFCAYVVFLLSLFNKRINIAKNRLALFIATFICILTTVHILVCGKAVVNSGFGNYVASAYENMTVGGVLISLVSMPLVLLCKYTASWIIFFIADIILSFFIIKPYVLVSGAGKSERRSIFTAKKPRIKEEGEGNPVIPTPEPEVVLPVKEEPVIKAEPKKEEPTKEEELTAEEILFGKGYKKKPVNNPYLNNEPIVDWSSNNILEPKKSIFDKPKSDYTITDGFEAKAVKPSIEPYTSNYLSRQEAAEKLFNRNLQSEYKDNVAIRQPFSDEEKLADEASRMSMTEFIPDKVVIFDDTEKKEQDKEVEPESVPTPVDETVTEEETTTAETEEETEYKVVENDFTRALRQEVSDIYAPAPLQPTITEVKKEPKPVFKPIVVPTEKPVEIVKEEPVAEPVKEGPLMVKMPQPYNRPPLSVFSDHINPKYTSYVDNYEEAKEVFEVKLKNYGVDITLISAVKGPTITQFILDLSDKCPISKVYTIKQDIKRLLMADGEINIIPQIANSSYFGIEVPNKVRGVVSFKEVLASPEYANAKGDIVIALGKTADGKIMVDDLAAMPHALIAGSTGSGKSVCIHTILASIIYRYSPEEVQLILVDLKQVEMVYYNGLPHMIFKEALSDVDQIKNALNWTREESERRYTLFKDNKVRDIGDYNANCGEGKKIPRIVIVIDEASELMSEPTVRKTVEATLSSLARKSRAAGIHLIFATQNPTKDVITNEIQNNLNTKIAFAVGEWTHSMVIFKAKGAETLLGKGDMLIKKNSQMVRGQCSFINTDEVTDETDYIREHNDCEFDEGFIDRALNGVKQEIPEPSARDNISSVNEQRDSEREENMQVLVKKALKICVLSGRASGSLVQRKLNKGYITAANVMDKLEEMGYVSPQVNKVRKLLITKDQYFKMYPEETENDD